MGAAPPAHGRLPTNKVRCTSFHDVNTVKITVGPDKARFFVRHHKLCAGSGFFRAALTSGFKEATEQVIDLPEDDLATVDAFIYWIYSGSLPSFGEETLTEIENATFFTSIQRLPKIYVFAEKYDISILKRCATIKLMKLVKLCRPPHEVYVTKIYAMTGEISGLRRLMCDWYVWKFGTTYLGGKTVRESCLKTPEFAADLIAACTRHWKKCGTTPTFEEMNVSDYF